MSSPALHRKPQLGLLRGTNDRRLLAALLIGINLFVFVAIQRSNVGFAKGDFKMFYMAALVLRSGHSADLYDSELYVAMRQQSVPTASQADVRVYTHPPYELLIFLPFTFLPYVEACYCWVILTLLLGMVCGRLMRSQVAVFGMIPLLAVLWEQQDSIIVLLLLIGAWFALQRDRNVLAGFILGLALFKFQTIVPIGLLLGLWRPRLLRGLAISGAAAFAASVAMAGRAGMVSYWRLLLGMASSSLSHVSTQFHMDPRTATIRGVVYALVSGLGDLGEPSRSRLIIIVTATICTFMVCLAWLFMRGDSTAKAKFSFAVMAGMLLSFHLYGYDLILLSLPFVLLAGSPARLPLAGFYVPLLVILWYSPAQPWLAIFPVLSLLMLSRQYGGPSHTSPLHS
jgi:hypothetical protein